MEKNLQNKEARDKFKKLVDDIKVCMFITNNPESDHTRPMFTIEVDDDDSLWFFTDIRSLKVEDVKDDKKVHLVYAHPGKESFMDVWGIATINTDKKNIKDKWSPMMKAWFQDGVDDPNLCLLKVKPQNVYYWDAEHGKMISILKMVVAAVTGKNVGEDAQVNYRYNEMEKEEIIPENNSGIQTNTESFIDLKETREVQDFFDLVKSRLLNINSWHECAGKATADFELCNEKGDPVNRKPETGDHIRIDIPGPGTITGEGDDWVKIEEVIDEEDCACIRVRPATNPLNERKDIAHFFSDEATSTFMVKKSGNKITAGIYGRNEKPNTGTEKIIDKVRNAAIATGAISGFSKLQWKSLVEGLIKK